MTSTLAEAVGPASNANDRWVIAGQAGYWFIGGASSAHSMTRNLLVIPQFFVGLAIRV